MAVASPADEILATIRPGTDGTPSASDRSTVGDTGNISSTAQNEASQEFTPSDLGAAAAQVDITRNTEERYAKTRSIILIKDKVHAVLAIVPNAGSGGQAKQFENFILSSVRQVQQERYQIVEPFGPPIIYFMDKAPEVYDFAGILYNAKLNGDDQVWRDEFLSFYNRDLRGTQCVRKNTRAFIDYDGLQIGGYVLSTYLNQDANDQNHVLFGFQLYVTSVKSIPITVEC